MLLASCSEKKSVRAPVASNPVTATLAPPLPAKPRFDPVVVQRGEALHVKALAKTADARLGVWGSGFPSVKASIWIPEEDWDSFSSEDREALVTYLKSQIPGIRSSPGRYMDIPSSAPAYSRIRGNIANMGDEAFVIFAMTLQGGQWIQGRTLAGSK